MTEFSNPEKGCNSVLTLFDEYQNKDTSAERKAEIEGLLIDEHGGIAFQMMIRWQNSFPENEREDLLQECRAGLLTAIRRFDTNRGVTFSTFAFAVIKNHLHSVWKQRQRQIQTISLDDIKQTKDDEERKHNESFLSYEDREFENIDQAELVSHVQKSMSARQWQIMVDKIDGKSFEAIARKFGFTKQAAHQFYQRGIAKAETVLAALN